MSGKGYKVHPLDNKDLEAIGGRGFSKSFIGGVDDGRYFNVDIAADLECGSFAESPCRANVKVRKVILFETGRYIIVDAYKYDRALDEFYANVAYKIEKGGISYKLFVIGEADALGDHTFEGWFQNGFRFDRMCYFPKFQGSESLFIPRTYCTSLSEPFHNIDLPDLRARFFQIMLEKHKFLRVEILDGSVAAKVISAARRNVTLLMYVPPEFFKEG